MEAVAKRAGVGKPTLYKWWPTKAGLVFAMFHERLARQPEALTTATVEEFMRQRVRRLIIEFHDLFGKVIAELIAEGQSDPKVLQELYDQHIGVRRAHAVVEIEKAKRSGEFNADTDANLLVDQIFGPIYYRMLLRITPLDHAFGDALLDQVLGGVRSRQPEA
jgi:AcrR family transcriptional regulator